MKILFWIYVFIFIVFLGTVKIKDEMTLEKEVVLALINLSMYNEDFLPNTIKKYLKEITISLLNSEDLISVLNKFPIDITDKKIRKINKKIEIFKNVYLKANNDFNKVFNFRFLSFDLEQNLLTVKLFSKKTVNVFKGDNELIYKLVYLDEKWEVIDIS